MLFGLKEKGAWLIDLTWCFNILILFSPFIAPFMAVSCTRCDKSQTIEGHVESVDFVTEDSDKVLVIFHFRDNRIVKLRMRPDEPFDCKMDQQIKVYYDSHLLIKKIEKYSLDFH